MHTVVRTIDRPDPDIVGAFEGIPTAIVSDVTSKYENTMTSDIKPVWDVPTMVGTAITVKTYPGDNLMVHKAITLAEPGDVLVVDANGYTEAGLMGELMSRSCQVQGLNGSIVDGAVRDIDDIEEMAYPVYSRGISPKGSYKSHPGSINVPISCGGLEVHPGDIIVGDAEGIVKVKPENASAVLEAAEQKLDDEVALWERIENGEYIYDVSGHDDAYNALDITEKERQ